MSIGRIKFGDFIEICLYIVKLYEGIVDCTIRVFHYLSSLTVCEMF